jgi:hypothetical protein
MQETENNVEVTEEVTNETVENTVEETVAEEPQRELTPEEQIYEDLKVKRMGKFVVGMGHGDATYFRNLLDKSEYKGPQQAYLLIVAKAELSQVCEGLKGNDKTQRYEVELTSACIESVGFFMNNFTGKGSDSATKLFTASMLLRPAMGEINRLDEELADAKKNLTVEDK